MKNLNILTTVAALSVSFLLAACASINEQNSAAQSADVLHPEGPEMRSVGFKSGKPATGDNLIASVEDIDEASKTLEMDLDIIKSVPSIRFQAVGSTDDKECSVSECDALSARRAALVSEWLIQHGVPSNNLAPPRGMGRYFSADYEPSDGHRRMARRVDILAIDRHSKPE